MRKDYAPKTIAIYDRKNDTVYKETSLIAIDKKKEKILAVGNEASKLIDNENSNILVFSPLKQGVIADYTASQKIFSHLLHKAAGQKWFVKPKIAVCIPVDSTEVEKKAFLDAFYQSGAKEVFLSEEPAGTLNQTLPSSYRFIVEIIQEEESGHTRKELWNEACKGEIPPAAYRAAAITSDRSTLTISLENAKYRITADFDRTIAIRMLDKRIIPDGTYSASELERFRKDGYQNVIYRIQDGEFASFIKQGQRAKALSMNSQHYIIITENYAVEIISEKEPHIIVSKKNN